MLKSIIEEEYKKIVSVFNIFFDEKIKFDNYGLNHLFKSRGISRPVQDVRERSDLIKLIIPLLQNKFPPTEFARRDYKDKYWVDFYTFIYAYTEFGGDDYKIKVVIREKTDKSKHFYSIFKIPHVRHKKLPITG